MGRFYGEIYTAGRYELGTSFFVFWPCWSTTDCCKLHKVKMIYQCYLLYNLRFMMVCINELEVAFSVVTLIEI